MTSENNPMTKWILDSLTKCVQDVLGMNLTKLMTLPAQLEAIAATSANLLGPATSLATSAANRGSVVGGVRDLVSTFDSVMKTADAGLDVAEDSLQLADSVTATLDLLRDLDGGVPTFSYPSWLGGGDGGDGGGPAASLSLPFTSDMQAMAEELARFRTLYVDTDGAWSRAELTLRNMIIFLLMN
jgi:hypothetical protein